MSFLEITKIHLARQEGTRSASSVLILDGHLMRRIIWKSPQAIVLQDPDGHFWRCLSDSGRCESALIKPKSN
jgi:hypothetical protein